MKSLLLIPAIALLAVGSAQAQAKIWRCGNTYTNNEAQAKAGGCKVVEGGNVTVVEGTRVSGASGSSATSAGNNGVQRVKVLAR